ncbi:uncharacterized protein Z518_07901 [Rhinocladiella mackenziei CBS 650.93]|uniref:SnoaL-like domain-containing protein n=1 Tax=Rhinocladiella mackenziei CBS 650.93 TaxID=1442369 RepID=A0A0D2FJ08_9EURO|nr:uncharacterized protein Z518_07901 [Rhinocladiella mackenziei CBS 650.93]KIX01962.1 hypothetical protein Z518_07901 [Rhinocladiella mackenziei CBS 650.93]
MSSTPEKAAPAVAHALAYANLMSVFSNRDPISRLEAIKSTYHNDVVFLEPNEIIQQESRRTTR